MKLLITNLLRILLPLTLVLAQHGVWAHGFDHDVAKIAAHGQAQDQTTDACCLPFQTSGGAACGAPALGADAMPTAAISAAAESGRLAATCLPYLSHAPPPTS